MIGQGGIPDPDQPVIFTAEIGKEAEKFNTILKWNVNNSEKIEGQGTKQIKVLWKGMCNTNLTATIEVFGLPKDCQSTASETAAIMCCRFQPLIVDEFSVPATRIDKIKLDNLITASKNNPDAQIYIIERFSRNTSLKAINRKNRKILDYLKMQGIETDSITLQNAFADENLTQFFIVYPGASEPECFDCITVNSIIF